MAAKTRGSAALIATRMCGFALHGIGETFSPDPHTGTANFTVPLALLPGRNGLAPHLALAYSGKGNGPLGLGWRLEVPEVARKTSKDVPHYSDSAEPFLLSGAEDPVPIDLTPGAIRYRPRTEGLLYQSALSLTLGGIPRFEEFRFDGSQRRFAGRVHRMGQALTITRTDHCAADLRAAASKSDDAAQVRRLLAIALALDGDPRSEAAERSGMDRQTLRDWVHRYNDGGIDGLKSRSSPGRAPRLTDAQKAELKALVIAGPDPEHDGVVRWRCADLQAVIERRFSVQVHESTVGKWLHQLGLTRLQPRPVHPKKDPAAEQAFKKNFGTLLKDELLGCAAGTPVEIWFQDEARVGQKGSHAYVWAPVGARPLMVRDNRHDSAYLFGAICPARGVGAAIIMPAANAEAMNEHLAEISTQIMPGAHAVLLCDGAGWHQTGDKLRVPKNISLLPIPPYSPELNPMENVWAYLRSNKLCALIWNSYDAIVSACKEAWSFLISDPKRIQSIGHREWTCVNL